MATTRGKEPVKIGIVGSGLVGATAAYALIMRGLGREIVLIDKNTERAEAEADDLLHGQEPISQRFDHLDCIVLGFRHGADRGDRVEDPFDRPRFERERG